MTIEEAIKYLKEMKDECNDTFHKVRYVTKEETLDMAIKALEKEPCEDAISRQAVIDSLTDKFADGFDSDRWWNSMSVLYAINKVPSVNPQEPKTGHWKRISMDKYSEHAKYWYRCDRCGKDNLGNTDYCPSCGCRMVEIQESEDKE